MNPDTILEVILKSNPKDIQALCSTNKLYNSLCKKYSYLISKTMLNREQVNYKNPNNFIYYMNKVEYDPNRSLHDIFKLYMAVREAHAKHMKELLAHNRAQLEDIERQLRELEN